MHRKAAEIARVVHETNFEEMSHHTGAPLIAFPRQIMELTNWFRHVQIIYRHVPAFQSAKGVRLK